jgi:hypothetical protein
MDYLCQMEPMLPGISSFLRTFIIYNLSKTYANKWLYIPLGIYLKFRLLYHSDLWQIKMVFEENNNIEYELELQNCRTSSST